MKRHRFGKSEQGLTLVESMVALVIFSTIIVMATPPIILSMASRIRSYRAQQALQIAQAQLDRTKIVLENDVSFNATNETWNNKDKLPPDAGMGNPQAVSAPTSAMPTVPCSDSYKPATASAMCYVDTNKNGNFDSVDFAVQTFRSCEHDPKTGFLGFFAGVRVYPYGSLASGQTLETKQASLGFSAATTATRGPLAVQYERLVKTDTSQNKNKDTLLGDYNDFLKLSCQ